MTLPDTPALSIDVEDVPGPDFTAYSPLKGESDERDSPKCSYEGSVVINCRKTTTSARGLKCRSYGGNYWSITLRSNAKNIRKPANDYSKRLEGGLLEYAHKHSSTGLKVQDFLGYCPVGYEPYLKLSRKPPSGGAPAKPPGEIFLNNISDLCCQLHAILFSNRTIAPTGLITITGATDSSKSLITRGLIFLYLRAAAEDALKRKLRRPHLVTFEDPIEEYYLKDPEKKSDPPALNDLTKLLEAIYIDYTPREKKKDALRLADAVKDAKRQTPAVFFVAETREAKDWKELLDFAGSGHLVITTSHAASVVEAMTQIFRETGTENASQRSAIARRILGIINLRPFQPTTPKITSNVRVLLPSVWKSTSQSINNLVADGLSSILPALDREEEIGYYGRTFFARKLIEKATKQFTDCDDRVALEEEINRKAREWDIRGV